MRHYKNKWKNKKITYSNVVGIIDIIEREKRIFRTNLITKRIKHQKLSINWKTTKRFVRLKVKRGRTKKINGRKIEMF